MHRVIGRKSELDKECESERERKVIDWNCVLWMGIRSDRCGGGVGGGEYDFNPKITNQNDSKRDDLPFQLP